MGMERTQISLSAEQAERLRRVARKRGTSMAALIREAVDRVVPNADTPSRSELWARALSVAGGFATDGSNVSRDHDRYLDEIYGQRAAPPTRTAQ